MKKYNQFILEKLNKNDIINYYSSGDESYETMQKFLKDVDLKADIGKEYNVFGLLLVHNKYKTVEYAVKHRLFNINDNIYIGHQVGKITNFISPLMFVAARWKTEMLKFFLEQPEIDLELKDKHGNTALIYASANGHISNFKLLLEKGANPYVTVGGNNIIELADANTDNRWLQDYLQTYDFQDWFLTKYPDAISMFSDDMLSYDIKIKYADLISGKDLNLL